MNRTEYAQKMIFVFLFLLAYTFGESQENTWTSLTDNPIELGKVHWNRDYQKAIDLSMSSNKPIFLFFQEVPGCFTCQKFGNQVMSDPFVVEGIEQYFIPLVIYNNKGGKDVEILKKFKEPSWNNPVIRIIDHNGKNLIERISGRYDRISVLSAMIECLQKKQVFIEPYLINYLNELISQQNAATTHFGMYCFWSGEKALGQIEGVIATEAGFMAGGEVVEIVYDPNIIPIKDLVKEASKSSSADRVYLSKEEIDKFKGSKERSNFRKDRESKYYLFHSKYSKIPMTKAQALKVNSLLGKKKNPDSLLSPRQLYLMDHLKSDKRLYDQEFASTWFKTINQL